MPMTKEQALQLTESIFKAWLGTLGDNFSFEKAASAQQALIALKEEPKVEEKSPTKTK